MKDTNTIFNSTLDSTINNRYCPHCNVQLIHNPKNDPNFKYIYSCPRCNVSTINIHQTQPGERLATTFPSSSSSSSSTSHVNNSNNNNSNESSTATTASPIYQNTKDRLPRYQLFAMERAQERNNEGAGAGTGELNDPYTKQLMMQNNRIKITNIDYYSSYYDDDEVSSNSL